MPSRRFARPGSAIRRPSTINLGYVVEEGPRVYIERINVRGNTRTRDYVIRRELDLGEGDAYNKVLIDRAERRLNNLGYFKKVRISNEPGSAPDRVVVNIDVEDQPTGAVLGRRRLLDGGRLHRRGLGQRIELPRPRPVRAARRHRSASARRASISRSPSRISSATAWRRASTCSRSTATRPSTPATRTATTGGQLRLGLPVTEEFGFTLRYSLYQPDLKIPNTIKQPYNDCARSDPGLHAPQPPSTPTPPLYPNCAYDGEASIAIKESTGKTLTSLAGLTIGYNDARQPEEPAQRPLCRGQAGGRRSRRRLEILPRHRRRCATTTSCSSRTSSASRASRADTSRAWAGRRAIRESRRSAATCASPTTSSSGPTLVRGFAPSGFGPRDISIADSTSNSIGGTTYYRRHRSRRSSRSGACRASLASRARSSPTPAPCSATRGRAAST